MIKIFASNQPFVTALIPLLIIGHMALDIFFPDFRATASLANNLWDFSFEHIDRWFLRLGGLMVLSLNAFILNRTFNSHEFYEKNTYLPSLIYLLLVFLFPSSLELTNFLISHTFFILCISKIYDIKQNDDARASTFLAGLFLGMAITFQPAFIYFTPFLWLCTISIRPFVIREYVLPLLGILIVLAWVFLVNPDFYETFLKFDSSINYSDFDLMFRWSLIVVLLLLIIIGYKNIFDRYAKSSIRFKRISGLTNYVFLFSLIIGNAALVISGSLYYFGISSVILSYILPYAYLDIRPKWASAILIYLLLVINVVKFLY
ncbi:MAG: DUF6427 family protein [Brumimicrobium sp.]|nr:DUF6427 family protein [Brumimicrobium sp.]